jgi:MFS family permease
MTLLPDTAAPAPQRLTAKPAFHGWRVVAAVFVMLMVSAGVGFYGQALYLTALVSERGFSVGAVSGATAVFFLTTGLAGVAVAHLIARFDIRIVVTGSVLVAAAALVALGQATALWQVYASYALLAAGCAGTALVPATTTVTRWFRRRRAVALSIASTGMSIGGIALVPVVAGLIAWGGMTGATPWLALLLVVGILPITLLWLRSSPENVGETPDGEPVDGDAEARRAAAPPLKQILTSGLFLTITTAFALVMFAQVAAFGHHYNLVTGRAGQATAALAVPTVALSSIVGRLIGGWIATRISTRSLAFALILVQAVSLLVLGGGSTTATLIAGSVLLGLTMGNLIMLHPLVLVDTFGDADAGKLFSASGMFMTAGMAAGPATIGLLHDLSGGYLVGYTVAAVVSVAGALVLALASRVRKPGSAAPTG